MSHRFLRRTWGPSLLALSVAACAGSQPKQAGEGDNFDPSPSGSAAADSAPAPKWNSKSETHASKDDLTPENKQQMEDALARGGRKAAQCASVVDDAARGEGEVKVTFDGKAGKIVDVAVGAPWAGTDAESCIKRAFVGEYSLRFEGQLEVPYTVKLAPKAEPDKGKKKK